MSYRVNVTSSVLTNWEDDNLRGEPRWERNVADCLLAAGRHVGLTMPMWKAEALPAGNWEGCEGDFSNDLMIIHSSTAISWHQPGGKYYIYHFFSGPEKNVVDEIEYFARKIGNDRVIVTHSFRSAPEYSFVKNIFKDRFFWLTTPAIKMVHREVDNFNAKRLLWSSRYMAEQLESFPEESKRLFEWILSKLKEDEDLTFDVMTGYDENYLINIKKIGPMEPWLWNQPSFAVLRPVADRVNIYPSLHWREVVKLTSETKLVVSPPKRYGGPPLEAAAYGIPTIGLSSQSSFHDEAQRVQLSNYIHVSGSDDPSFIGKLENLYSNHAYYRTAGDEYREYADQYYSYNGFVKMLDSITTQKNWSI